MKKTLIILLTGTMIGVAVEAWLDSASATPQTPTTTTTTTADEMPTHTTSQPICRDSLLAFSCTNTQVLAARQQYTQQLMSDLEKNAQNNGIDLKNASAQRMEVKSQLDACTRGCGSLQQQYQKLQESIPYEVYYYQLQSQAETMAQWAGTSTEDPVTTSARADAMAAACAQNPPCDDELIQKLREDNTRAQSLAGDFLPSATERNDAILKELAKSTQTPDASTFMKNWNSALEKGYSQTRLGELGCTSDLTPEQKTFVAQQMANQFGQLNITDYSDLKRSGYYIASQDKWVHSLGEIEDAIADSAADWGRQFCSMNDRDAEKLLNDLKNRPTRTDNTSAINNLNNTLRSGLSASDLYTVCDVDQNGTEHCTNIAPSGLSPKIDLR